MSEAPYLRYAIRWRTGEARPGKHASRASGQGGDFRGVRPFWQVPDARRIDVRRSIMDPFGDVQVRQTENRGAITVVVAGDVSRSMAPLVGEVATLVEAGARAAHRAGDGFGFLGFDESVREDLRVLPSRARGPALDLVAGLRGLAPAGRGAGGILGVAEALPARRCLVLLVSDFLMPLGMLEAGLASLARHDVAPVVLYHAREEVLPLAGLVRLQDSETGRMRLLVMRPGVRRRWVAAREAWRARIDDLFLRYARPAFHVEGGLDIPLIGEHLLAC